MDENDLKEFKSEKPEEEIIDLAKRILKVYGKVETPTLDKEIKRMAEILSIPLKEVTHGL